MFADTRAFMIYVTFDEGRRFTAYSIPVDPKTLKVHPTMAGWLLGHDSVAVCIIYSVYSLIVDKITV